MSRKFTNTLFIFLFLNILLCQAQIPADRLDINAFQKKLNDAGASAQILDARSNEEYKQNHLKGAINLAVKNEAEIQQQINTLDKHKPVFVYSIGNGRSGQLAKRLKEQQFDEVYELPGGLSKWIGSGRPVVSSVGEGLTTETYQKLIQSDKLVLVDVSSKYCGSCKKLLPIVDSIASENESNLHLVKVEFFENKQLAQGLKVDAIPHLILYKNNKVVWEKTGVTPKSEIQAAIHKIQTAQ